MTPSGRSLRALAIVALAIAAMAHVGSPDTFFTGQAGPYPVRVIVRLPGAIPGLAQVSVRLPSSTPQTIRRVTVQAIQWNLGPEGAPPADVARAVPGDPELHAADLWLMVPTSYRVHVVVDGPGGSGTAIVPVVALATAERAMSRGLSVVLAGLGVFLAVGLLTIVGAAVRESVIPPGHAPDSSRRRRARVAVIVGALLIVAAAWGGRAWWNLEARGYAESVLYRPFACEATVSGDGSTLTLHVKDSRWSAPRNSASRYNALMPDHGKLMHMFLIREPDLDTFAHVHPVPRAAAAEAFDLPLPPLPAGRYRVYGDIVHESGYAQTLVASAEIAAPHGDAAGRDPDDSWYHGRAEPESDTAVFASPDLTIAWMRGPARLVEGQERQLTFAARNADGSAAALEPYMGMIGHVAVASADGRVFAHLHPAGSISMAALTKFERAAGRSVAPHAMHPAPAGSEISIPYAFPRPGRYRIWVQMKRAGRVVTGAFDADVLAAREAATSSRP